ncbi:hypothetical protein BH09MYX1_BH09MYX1_27090 [soil metagenome]
MANAALLCPECGGPLPEGAERAVVECSFCKRRVAPVAPAKAKEPDRVLVERIVVVERSGETSMPCPRCGAPLFAGKGETTTIHGCGKCGGVWLDNDASRRVVQAFDFEIVNLARRASQIGTTVDDALAVGCPICRATLVRTIVRGVALDVCASHGTWFDKDELRRVADAFEAQRQASVSPPAYS